MNKMLIKLLLVCMILICLSSGTLAVYTTTLDNQMLTSVNAKKFFIGVNQADEFNAHLAPGERAYSEFTVTNVDNNGHPTEVDMDLTIAADYSALYDALDGISVYMTEIGNPGFRHDANADGSFEYKESRAFKAEVSDSRTFKMTFEWTPSEDNQIASAGRQVSGLTMYITGTQHIN